MRQRIKHYVLALDDTALLALYAACWLLALFAPTDEQLALATARRVLSAVAATVVFVLWIGRPALRLGWRWRDIWLLLLVGLAVVQANRSPIRHVAFLHLLQTLELAAIYVTAAYLCSRRPQPLFLTTALLMVAATAAVWQGPRLISPALGAVSLAELRARLFPSLDLVRLAGITGLILLAALPWLAVRQVRTWRHWYQWVVFGAAAALVALEVAGGWAGRGSWVLSQFETLPAETRNVIISLAEHSWVLGCGPGHYEWVFRAQMPEEFAGQIASVSGSLRLFAEGGVVGFAAMLGFGLAMLWHFRPGPWAIHHGAILGLARPLRWVSAYALLTFLATPSLSSPFGQTILWSLLGMLRAWSSRERPAAVSLVVERPEQELIRASAVEPTWRWRQAFLLVGVLLGGIGLVVLHLRPWIATRWRHRPAGIARSDAAYLERLELARLWWPHDPRTHELEAIHYRAKANAGQRLSLVEIEAVTIAYERMIRSNPYDPFSHHALARWYVVQGKREQAVEVTERGLTYCPASFDLQYLLARIYRDLGNLTLARRAYDQARLLRPQSLHVLLNLADLELRLGNVRRAQRYLKMAHQLAPDDRTVSALLEAIRTGKTNLLLDQLGNEVRERTREQDRFSPPRPSDVPPR